MCYNRERIIKNFSFLLTVKKSVSYTTIKRTLILCFVLESRGKKDKVSLVISTDLSLRYFRLNFKDPHILNNNAIK